MASITQATQLYLTLKATAAPTNAPDQAALTRILGELAAAIATYNGVANGVAGALPNFVGGTQFYGPWLVAYTTAFTQCDVAARQALGGYASGTSYSALTFDTTTPTFNLLMARINLAIGLVPTTSPAETASLVAYRVAASQLFTSMPSASDPVWLAFQASAQGQVTAAYLDAGGWATAQGISYS